MRKFHRSQSAWVCCVLALLICAAGAVFGQAVSKTVKPTGAAGVSRAALVSAVTPSQVKVGDTFTVEVMVDLSNARQKNGSPASLAAYIVNIGFDHKLMEFVEAQGGATPAFSSQPTATSPEIANEKGLVIVNAVHLNNIGPMRQLSVARLTFRAKQKGAGVFTFDPASSGRHSSLATHVQAGGQPESIQAGFKNGAVSFVTQTGRVTRTVGK